MESPECPLCWIEAHAGNPNRRRSALGRFVPTRCAACGNVGDVDPEWDMDWWVSDEEWQRIIPEKYQNKTICPWCFVKFAQQKGERYKVRYIYGDASGVEKINPDHSAETLIETCKTHFGTTKDAFDAGYILPDGSMLDFKRSKRPSSGQFTQHHAISGCLPKNGKPTGDEAIAKFTKDTGAIRMAIWGPFLYFDGTANIKPTGAQARILGKLCREKDCTWSIRTPEGTDCELSKQPARWTDYLRAFERCKHA